MADYRNLSPEELAANESFRRWILFDSPQDRLFWKEWSAVNPDRSKVIESAARLLELTEGAFNQIGDEEIGHELERLSVALESSGRELPVRSRFRIVKWYFAAAATFLLCVLGWWFYAQPEADKNSGSPSAPVAHQPPALERKINGTAKAEVVYLSDGSAVTLQPGSRLSYPSAFTGQKREVFLTGEAFFDVVKKPGHPFIVYAGTLATKVLGTSFRVRALENDRQVTVVVKTGKVSVFPISAEGLKNGHLDDTGLKEGMILTPNQKIVYNSGDSRLTRSLVEIPEMLTGTATVRSFNFRATPAREVFAALSEAYGVDIIFDQEAMRSCYLTAALDHEPLFEKIDLICKTFGAEFEQMDGTIIISSRGCH
ncbi:MAG: hypothetical protein ABS46_13520 [Cytophagaceae bacterium SCN 52-12]|nr:MAG: hypothetical protein ABS46_13520 [Cytophagaceae bacterium SCN 52-12]